MSQYTELPPEQAINPENPLAPGVPADVARDGVDADLVRTASGGTTPATSGTLADTANADHLVEIFDGTTSKGIARVGANGTWTHTITVAAGARSITAKALDGTQPVSLAWTFTVETDVTPDITSVIDPQGAAIPNGGTTAAPSITLTGTATANQQVEIFDGTTSKAIVNVDGNGDWTATSIAIVQGAHSFTARARYGSEQSSLTWTLTRAPRLTIDTSTLNLQGWNISLASTFSPSWTRTAYQFPNISATRTPSDGTRPYTYTSADPRIAEVGLTTGTVISRATGNTTITVTDNSGQTQNYPVSCNNVVELINLTTLYTHAQARDALQRLGYALLPHPTATVPGRGLWEGIQQAYSPTGRMIYWAWERASPGDEKAPAMAHTGPGSRPTWSIYTPISMNSPNPSIGYRLKRAGQ